MTGGEGVATILGKDFATNDYSGMSPVDLFGYDVQLRIPRC